MLDGYASPLFFHNLASSFEAQLVRVMELWDGYVITEIHLLIFMIVPNQNVVS